MNNAIIVEYKERHERILHDLIHNADIPADKIKQAMSYVLFPGGKRMRPLLVYLCGELIGIDRANLDIIAAAIELIHCYSLVHDDLPAMDDDDTRRGKPSCHRAFDEATAILVGDGMQALAIDILLQHLPHFLSPNRIIAVTQELVKACGPAGMVSGQSLDLSELTNPNVTESQLSTIHSLKTGKLITACINMVLACDTYKHALALQTFANHLGIAFQMQDDYLDQYGCTNEIDILGKGRASDLANQKITYANLYEQNKLRELIMQHFKQAEQALSEVEKKENLVAFLHDLQYRI